jgi:hypothetical protein
MHMRHARKCLYCDDRLPPGKPKFCDRFCSHRYHRDQELAILSSVRKLIRDGLAWWSEEGSELKFAPSCELRLDRHRKLVIDQQNPPSPYLDMFHEPPATTSHDADAGGIFSGDDRPIFQPECSRAA